MMPAVGYTEMKDSGIPWIGQIPKKWKVQKLFRCFGLIGSGTTPKSQVEDYYNGNIPWLQSGDINGGIVKSTAKSIKEIALTECSALRMYNAPFIAVAMYGASIANTSIVAIDACTNQACCVLSSPQNGIDYKFVFYAILSAKEELLLCARGGTQPNISQEILKQFRLPLPSLQEQTAIAAYLDTQCARIDEIIAEAKASIENYKQWKASIIYEAVTKGLDPDAEMKDSGVRWMGIIPKHWNVVRAKFHFTQTNGRGNETEILLAASQKYGVCPQSWLEGVVQVAENTDLQQFKTVHKNDFVISLRSFQGGFERSDFEGVCSPAYQVFHADSAYNNDYLKYLFKNELFIDEMNSLTVGIREGRNIKYDDFANSLIVVPTLPEQATIAAYLDTQCAKIDELSAEKLSLIADLEAYKKSIIYEVVTGKRRVC